MHSLKHFVIVTLLILLSLATAIARTASEWRSRTIYQLLTDRFAQSPGQNNPQLCANNGDQNQIRHYCGGTFIGIIDKLDYIKSMGFDAIWISPVVKQFEKETKYGPGWHGYWAQDIYEINPHFGTANDLKQLVAAAHARDIWVMVDVVANHMGPQQGIKPYTAEYLNAYTPFNKTEHYHDFCVIEHWDNDYEVEHCSLGGYDLPLPDLNTENPQVVDILNNWIRDLVREYNFDGIRIDTVKHVRKEFWSGFTAAAGVFSIGEMLHDNPYTVGSYQNYMDSVLGYPLFEKVIPVFTNPFSDMGSVSRAVQSMRGAFKDVTVLGNFIDNHDKPRFLSMTQDRNLLKNALTFVLLTDGIPIIYQGTEQGFNGGNDPWNREALWPSGYSQSSDLYQFIAKINKFRQTLPPSYFTSLSVEAWANDRIYAFFKDRALVVMTIYGTYDPMFSIKVKTNGLYNIGTELVNILNCAEKVTVDNYGEVAVRITGDPRIFYPSQEVKGLCQLKMRVRYTVNEIVI